MLILIQAFSLQIQIVIKIIFYFLLFNNYFNLDNAIFPTSSNITSFSGPPPNQPLPPLPPSASLLNIKSFQNNINNNENTNCNYNNKKNNKKNNLENTLKVSDNKEIKKNFDTRRSSNSKMSIEYQLLEEIDIPPHSPDILSNNQKLNFENTKNQNNYNCVNLFASEKMQNITSPFNETLNNNFVEDNINKTSSLNNVSSYLINNDPFDVKWSTEILQKSSVRKFINIK